MTARPRPPGAAALTRAPRAWTLQRQAPEPGAWLLQHRRRRAEMAGHGPGTCTGERAGRRPGQGGRPEPRASAPEPLGCSQPRCAGRPDPIPGTPSLGSRARATEEVGDASPATEPQPPAVPLHVVRPPGQLSGARRCARVAWAGPPEGPGRSARCCAPDSGLSEQPEAGRGQWAGERCGRGRGSGQPRPRLPLTQRRPAPAPQLRKCPQLARGGASLAKGRLLHYYMTFNIFESHKNT